MAKRGGLVPLARPQAAALSLKRRAEAALRGTGLGYTIVRPGPLLEEPGGYKALVFDQASRARPTPQKRSWPTIQLSGTALSHTRLTPWKCTAMKRAWATPSCARAAAGRALRLQGARARPGEPRPPHSSKAP